MREKSVSSYLPERIQPMWLHQKPSCFGLWMSSGVSEYLWWWRWLDAHHRTPFWADVWPSSARRNCGTRDSL